MNLFQKQGAQPPAFEIKMRCLFIVIKVRCTFYLTDVFSKLRLACSQIQCFPSLPTQIRMIVDKRQRDGTNNLHSESGMSPSPPCVHFSGSSDDCSSVKENIPYGSLCCPIRWEMYRKTSLSLYLLESVLDRRPKGKRVRAIM